jgi:hypothetical protein
MRELDTQPRQRSQYFWQLQFLIGHERQRFSAVLKVSSAPGIPNLSKPANLTRFIDPCADCGLARAWIDQRPLRICDRSG